MSGVNENIELSNAKKINPKKLAVPFGVMLLGLIVCAIFAPRTVYVNGGVWLGILITIIGTIMFLFALYNEIDRIGIATPFLLNKIFPSYPIVEDRNELDKHLSGFRKAINEFLSDKSIKQNAAIQNYSSQLLWHSLMLWKNRMKRFDLSLSLDADRRAYTSPKNSVRSNTFFDGRYAVEEVCEEINATRTFHYKGKEIYSISDKEIAHYTLLSAKNADENNDDSVICPNCGNITSRSNLIDGCDYCDTKFTVDDFKNSVGSFSFRRDFEVSESKREAIRTVIFPWVALITNIPFVYFGFFGAFLYMEGSLVAKFFTGLLAAVLLGLVGWFFVKINMFIVLPFVVAFNNSREKQNKKLLYRTGEEKDQENQISEFVRQYDRKFSLQSFFGGINNKLLAIHFANRKEEINAFSDVDLSAFLDNYKNVVDVDVLSLKMCSYEMKTKTQEAVAEADIILRDFVGGKIRPRSEKIRMRLEKNWNCNTQAPCAPSIMRCEGCGASLSLMDGKKCAYCGHELDMRKHDWVIIEYMNI